MLRHTVYFVAPVTEPQLIYTLVGPVAVTDGFDGVLGGVSEGVVTEV